MIPIARVDVHEFRPGGRWGIVVFSLGFGVLFAAGAFVGAAAAPLVAVVMAPLAMLCVIAGFSAVQSGIVVRADGQIFVTSLFFSTTEIPAGSVVRVDLERPLMMFVPLECPIVVFESDGRLLRRGPISGSPTWLRSSAAKRARDAIEAVVSAQPSEADP